MKLASVNKLDKRNKTKRKEVENVIFPIYGQSRAIWKPDSWRIVCKTYNFIKSNLFLSQKLKTELEHFQHSSHTITLSKDTISVKKMLIEENLASKKVVF